MKATLAVLLLLVVGGANVPSSAQTQLPTGDWSFSHRPYVRPGAEAHPVRVTSVKGEASRLEISAEAISNQSGKNVSGLRLSWYLTRDGEPNVVLRSGTTPTVFPLDIPSGASHQGNVPVMAFADVYQPLVISGQLRGRFVLEVAVTEVQYTDGTVWRAEGLPAKSGLVSAPSK